MLGSFPTGYLVGKLHGLDLRRLGSGSTGGTNVWRHAGMGAALLTIAGDALKALAAVYLANILVGTGWSQVLAGTLAVLGHIYSPFLGWKGGRGVVAALAVMGALCFPALAVVLLAGAIVILASRYVSLASLTVATLMPVTLYAFTRLSGGEPWWPVYGVVAAVIIWVAHLGNVKRLIRGTERRIVLPPKVLEPLFGRRRAG
ncbi:MAG: glycerol-3-phosphate acyltransferase [Anaerolineae bacterium]